MQRVSSAVSKHRALKTKVALFTVKNWLFEYYYSSLFGQSFTKCHHRRCPIPRLTTIQRRLLILLEWPISLVLIRNDDSFRLQWLMLGSWSPKIVAPLSLNWSLGRLLRWLLILHVDDGLRHHLLLLVVIIKTWIRQMIVGQQMFVAAVATLSERIHLLICGKLGIVRWSLLNDNLIIDAFELQCLPKARLIAEERRALILFLLSHLLRRIIVHQIKSVIVGGPQ